MMIEKKEKTSEKRGSTRTKKAECKERENCKEKKEGKKKEDKFNLTK